MLTGATKAEAEARQKARTKSVRIMVGLDVTIRSLLTVVWVGSEERDDEVDPNEGRGSYLQQERNKTQGVYHTC